MPPRAPRVVFFFVIPCPEVKKKFCRQAILYQLSTFFKKDVCASCARVEVQEKWKASFLGVSWNSKSRSGSEWTLAWMDSCADIEDGECEHEDARTVGIALLVFLN